MGKNVLRVGHWSSKTSAFVMEAGTLSINGTPAVGNTNFESPGVPILGADGATFSPLKSTTLGAGS